MKASMTLVKVIGYVLVAIAPSGASAGKAEEMEKSLFRAKCMACHSLMSSVARVEDPKERQMLLRFINRADTSLDLCR